VGEHPGVQTSPTLLVVVVVVVVVGGGGGGGGGGGEGGGGVEGWKARMSTSSCGCSDTLSCVIIKPWV